jgi:hypothetical protein
MRPILSGTTERRLRPHVDNRDQWTRESYSHEAICSHLGRGPPALLSGPRVGPEPYDSSGAPKSSGSSQRSGGGLVDNATSGAGKAATDMTTDDPKKPDWRAGDSDGAQVAPPVDSTGTLKANEEEKAK